jgi:hypothetical protein
MARRVPQLTAEVVANDELLGAAVDRVLLQDPQLRALSRLILQAQKALQARLSPEQWACYLSVEEATNERLAEALLIVARWAFRAGRRAR